MKLLGQCVTVLGVYLVFIAMPLGPNRESYLPGGILGIIVLSVGRFIIKHDLRKVQKAHDALAKAVFERVPLGSALFSLYLRPFSLSRTVSPERTEFALFVPAGDQFQPGNDSIERQIAEAVNRTAPLVGLGDRGMLDFGQGSAGLVDQWQRQIGDAMEAAAYIFVVPSTSPGTLWEIGELKKRALLVSKTVFIMPPPAGNPGTTRTAWEDARVACSHQHRVVLPPYVESGALFRTDGPTIIELKKLTALTPRRVAMTINALFSNDRRGA